MSDDPQVKPAGTGHGLRTLEICFLAVVGLFTLAAFAEAFTYALVSSRTPFVIMTPMLILMAIHALRLRRSGALSDVSTAMSTALRGGNPVFNRLATLALVFLGTILAIWIFGHYVGVFFLVFVLTRVIAREKLWLSLALSVGLALILYGLFEYGFRIELYRGLVYRWLAGYRM